MKLGLDTGFFVRLLAADDDARFVWNRIVDEDDHGAIGCLTLYELTRLGLRGMIARKAARTLVGELVHLCRIVWIDDSSLIDRAARLAHGNDLSMADALIVSSFMAAEVERIYTTDAKLGSLAVGPEIHVLG